MPAPVNAPRTRAPSSTTPAEPARATTTPPSPSRVNDAFERAGALKGLFNGEKARPKEVSLTFDDGPHPENTPKVLDVLKRFGAKATFFVTGENAEKHPELIRRIVDEGHSLGSHSWGHEDLRTLDAVGVKENLDRTQQAVDRALGRRYELVQVRPPYGGRDAEVDAEVARRDGRMVMWNVDSNDWRHMNDDAAILKSVFEGSTGVAVRGGTILFHDIHPQTVRVIDDVVERLRRDGYRIVKTDAMLADKYGAA